MKFVDLNIGSYSGAGSSEGPPAYVWVSITLEEQLDNFKRIIQNQHSSISIDGEFNFKSVARAMEELIIDPCVDIESLLPFCKDLEHVGVPEYIGTMEYVLLGTTPLHWAVLMGDRTMVRYILTLRRVDVNASTRYWGETALHYAIIGGNHGIVKDLLDYKADVCIRNSCGKSAIYCMVLQEDSMFGILKTILAKDVNMCDEIKDTPLHHAAREGATNVVTYLLDEKADVNLCNQFGYTPIHYAVEKGSLDVVACLLQQNAHIDALNDEGWSPLHIAAKKGTMEMVTLLVEHDANVDALTKDGLCPLYIATMNGHLDIMMHLEEHNANVNAMNMNGLCLLHIAATWGHLNIVTHLVEQNANVDILDKDGRSPLHIATMGGHLGIMAHLLEHNANINALDEDNRSPLHVATMKGHLGIVAHLLEHKVDINALDKDKQSPLHIATMGGHLDIVMHLVEHNANVHVKDNRGNNLLHLAIQGYVRKFNMMEIVRFLLKCDVDANAKNVEGDSPFFAAVAKGHTKVVIEMLRSKEKIKLTEECHGHTAIEIAFGNGYEHIKRALLECDDVSRYVNDLYRDRQVYVDAANAILVGAALIASVTFASWLQPPLGYNTSYLDLAPDIKYVDVQHNVLLRAFWVFNTLSFYFAIGTVVFGARSVLPRRRMFIKAIVVSLNHNLLVTSILLACSVLFVIVAFGIAGCIVLTPTLKFQWYMIGPTIIGGLVCLVSLWFLFKTMVEDNL